MRTLTGLDPLALPAELLCSEEPVRLPGLVAHWAAVRAGRDGPAATAADLRRFWRDATVGVWAGSPEIAGRFFYNDDFSGFNFKRDTLKLDTVLDALLRLAADDGMAPPPALYVGSTTVATTLPGWLEANPLGFGALGPDVAPLASLWLGNRTRIAAHHDLPDNLACVVAGRRRFTLFPPQALPHLYVGPLDFTPAGQAISLVDITAPDLQRFPAYAQAQALAQVAELGPGDALFIPSLWWHHVEALDALNLLVNFWWRRTPAYMDTPFNALLLALLSVRDLPPAQRAAWRTMFEHHVFDAPQPAHLPPHAQGVLGPLEEEAARRLRARLLKALNR